MRGVTIPTEQLFLPHLCLSLFFDGPLQANVRGKWDRHRARHLKTLQHCISHGASPTFRSSQPQERNFKKRKRGTNPLLTLRVANSHAKCSQARKVRSALSLAYASGCLSVPMWCCPVRIDLVGKRRWLAHLCYFSSLSPPLRFIRLITFSSSTSIPSPTPVGT